MSENGQLFAWGWNEHGNLGNGSTANSPLPVRVQLKDLPVVDCFAGSGHSFAVLGKIVKAN
jgi:alpha-tubulin suppressor-like RCC1 family protein